MAMGAKRTGTYLGALVIAAQLLSSASAAVTIVADFVIDPTTPGSISDEFLNGQDRFLFAMILTTPVTLNPGDTFRARLTVQGTLDLRLSDSLAIGEMVGAVAQDISQVSQNEVNAASFSFLFSGVTGTLDVNPAGFTRDIIGGQSVATLEPAGLTDSAFQFHLLEVDFIYGGLSQWTLDRFSVALFADDIQFVPEPGLLVVLVVALGALQVRWRNERVADRPTS